MSTNLNITYENDKLKYVILYNFKYTSIGNNIKINSLQFFMADYFL